MKYEDIKAILPNKVSSKFAVDYKGDMVFLVSSTRECVDGQYHVRSNWLKFEELDWVQKDNMIASAFLWWTNEAIRIRKEKPETAIDTDTGEWDDHGAGDAERVAEEWRKLSL